MLTVRELRFALESIVDQDALVVIPCPHCCGQGGTDFDYLDADHVVELPVEGIIGQNVSRSAISGSYADAGLGPKLDDDDFGGCVLLGDPSQNCLNDSTSIQYKDIPRNGNVEMISEQDGMNSDYVSSTPKQGHMPIEMNRVNGLFTCKSAGDFYWRVNENYRQLVFAAPSNAKKGYTFCVCTVDITGANANQSPEPVDTWTWNRNENNPTLSPLVHVAGSWLGYVQDGKLIEA